jgi:hypothetical protein
MAAAVVRPFLEVQKQGTNVTCNRWSVAHSDNERTENKFVRAMCIECISIMYNVGFKLHVIMNVKQHGNRGTERQFDPQPTKEMICKCRRQQGQVILQYLFQNNIIDMYVS